MTEDLYIAVRKHFEARRDVALAAANACQFPEATIEFIKDAARADNELRVLQRWAGGSYGDAPQKWAKREKIQGLMEWVWAHFERKEGHNEEQVFRDPEFRAND